MISREANESPYPQGANESVYYTVTTTPWGGTPTSPSVTIYDVTGDAYTQITDLSTIMPTNSPTVSGDIITLSPLKALTAGNRYRVNVRFTSGGDIFEAFFEVWAED